MEKVYTKEEYAKAYTELIEVLKNIPTKDLKKIPRETIKKYIANMDTNYKYQYNVNLEFEEQGISHLTEILIANLYIQYWASDDEKEKIKNLDKKELYELELKKKEKYEANNIFENTAKEPKQEMIIVKEKTILQKIIDKFKKLLSFK